MQYLITFLEGFISFISPCMLPMLPLYISYFAPSDSNRKPLPNAIAFVIGFTLIFTSLGIFAGTIGSFLITHTKTVNLICGALIVFFGLNYLGVIKFNFLNGLKSNLKINGIFSAFIFGIIFSISLTPCVGAFLGSALTLATTRGSATEGFLLLLTYSLGLGIPFLISALFISKLKSTFNFIKKHYETINLISGIFLILVGISMITGYFNLLLTFLN